MNGKGEGLISIIIVNYNSAYLTKRAVESVFREDEDIEVIIVDNTSTSGEKEYLRDIFGSQKVTLIFNESNIGFARACNQAFSLSRGEFIFLLNPDAYVIPPCLSTLKEFMKNTPVVSAASPLLYWDSAMTYLFPYPFLPSPLQDFCGKLSQTFPAFGYLYSLCGRRKNLKLWKSSCPVKVKNLSGGTVMLRRSAIENVGGLFDEQFFLFYEDNDLFIRLRKAGYDLYIVPCAKAVHSYRHTAKKLEIMAQSRELYFKKHFGRNLLNYISSHIPDHPQKTGHIESVTWVTPPSFSVPAALRERYLFEWSPYPIFIPSVGYFGRGGTFILSEEVWRSLDRGNYYSRFSGDRELFSTTKTLFWRKD